MPTDIRGKKLHIQQRSSLGSIVHIACVTIVQRFCHSTSRSTLTNVGECRTATSSGRIWDRRRGPGVRSKKGAPKKIEVPDAYSSDALVHPP